MQGNVQSEISGSVAEPEVNQSAGTEGVPEQAQSSEQVNNIPETVPYDRFSQSIAEKNEIKRKYEEQVALNNELSRNVNQYLETQVSQNTVEQPNFETIDDVTRYIDSQVENRVKPIEEQRKQEKYINNINSYFSSNGEAAGLRAQIDQYYDRLPTYRKEAIVESVSRGDVTVLDELKSYVALQHNNNVQNMANESAMSDVNRTMVPNANRIVRETPPGMGDLISKGKETGNFGSVFQQLAKNSGLA